MKKIFLMIFFFLTTILVFSETFYVDNENTDPPWNGSLSDPFQTIQQAINDENVEENDVLQVRYGINYDPYDSFDLGNKKLNVRAYLSHNPVIECNSPDNLAVDMGSASGSTLEGFVIQGSSTSTGVLITDQSEITIKDCVITGVNKGINISDCQNNIIIDNCTISENEYGIYVSEAYPSTSQIVLKSSEIYENTKAIYLDGLYSIELSYDLFYDNDECIRMTYRGNSTYINRCTFSDNGDVFIWSSNSDVEITNSIIWDNTGDIFTGIAYDLNIDYCCIEDGYAGGTGNIDDDPLFCPEYPYEYFVMEGSPCIDTGDPTETDVDDTRYDMGWYKICKDIKYCEGESWNWISFPRLYREDNDEVDIVPALDDFLDWPFDLEMLFEQIFYSTPWLEYTYEVGWEPNYRYVKSSLGYKLKPDDAGDHYLPLQQSLYQATRLSDEWQLEYTLEEDDYCWMGYWLPYTQNIEAAFGDLFDDLVSVSAEDWYYEYSEFETPSSSTENKDMVYGKGYVVVFERDIEDFCWTDATSRGGREPGNPRPEPQYFSYNDLPSYEAIDVMEIPPDVVEIGVFEDDTCVGAVVVQDSCEQILVYTDISNRNPLPLTFEVVTNNRGETLVVSDYLVLNKQNGRYENRSIFSGQQKSSVVKFGDLQEPQNNIPAVKEAILHGNYPNPFNPTTTVAFSVPVEQEVELIIFNMKGQLVRELVQGVFTPGEHEVIWDGLDKTGKQVGSGLYLYRFKTQDMEISKKMLLLK